MIEIPEDMKRMEKEFLPYRERYDGFRSRFVANTPERIKLMYKEYHRRYDAMVAETFLGPAAGDVYGNLDQLDLDKLKK